MLKSVFQQSNISTQDHTELATVDLLQLYRQQIELQHIRYDEAQAIALKSLQDLLSGLLQQQAFEAGSLMQKLFVRKPKPLQSLYMYGGVGRGKTMLMDMFYDACPVLAKRRVHFHAFMLEVHEFTYAWRQQKQRGDVIHALADKIRSDFVLLCFDEFHVTDIADAMILGRLFAKLFDSGLIIVATSNRHPDELYKNGLQRELFLPFIQRLKQVALVMELAAKEDYRLQHLQALEQTYYSPIDDGAGDFLLHSYNELTVYAPRQPGMLHVKGRDIQLAVVHGDILMTSFKELCEQPLGALDYLEIACEFTTVIMADIPQLTAAKRNEAKRFTTLIDALYEQQVNFICTAAVLPQQLYEQGDGAFEFQRTISRLMEMQSQSYLANRMLA